MKYVLVLVFASNVQGNTSVDHVQFDTLSACEAAHDQYIKAFTEARQGGALDVTHFVVTTCTPTG
jgi:hypothetical protein